MARASGRDLEQLMKEYGDLTEEFAERGGYEYKSQIRGALKGLGIEEAQFKMPVELLAGGQKPGSRWRNYCSKISPAAAGRAHQLPGFKCGGMAGELSRRL